MTPKIVERRGHSAWMVNFSLVAGLLLFASAEAPGAVQNRPARGSAEDQVLGKQVESLLVEQALPALRQGYGDFFFATVVPLVEQMNADQLAALEEFAKEQGVESIQGELVAELVRRIEQGLVDLRAIERPELAAFVVSGIEAQVREQISLIRRFPVLADELVLPEPGYPTADLFWDVHVISNRLENQLRLVNWAATIAAPHVERARARGEADLLARLESVGPLADDLRAIWRTLVLNAAEFRLMSLERSVSELRNETDFEQRILAAWAFEDNARLLREFLLMADPAAVARERLTSPGLVEHVDEQLQLGLDYGKDVIEKAQLLRLGCFWWLRGRCGGGPLANGLLKDASAMQSEELMFGLYMPIQPRLPVCSRLPEEDRLPGPDRRHFQTWAVEYRPRISENSLRTATTTKRSQTVEKSKSSTFW